MLAWWICQELRAGTRRRSRPGFTALEVEVDESSGQRAFYREALGERGPGAGRRVTAPSVVYLGFGSNLGDRQANLAEALQASGPTCGSSGSRRSTRPSRSRDRPASLLEPRRSGHDRAGAGRSPGRPQADRVAHGAPAGRAVRSAAHRHRHPLLRRPHRPHPLGCAPARSPSGGSSWCRSTTSRPTSATRSSAHRGRAPGGPRGDARHRAGRAGAHGAPRARRPGGVPFGPAPARPMGVTAPSVIRLADGGGLFYATLDLFVELRRPEGRPHVALQRHRGGGAGGPGRARGPVIESLAERIAGALTVGHRAPRADAEIRAQFPLERRAPTPASPRRSSTPDRPRRGHPAARGAADRRGGGGHDGVPLRPGDGPGPGGGAAPRARPDPEVTAEVLSLVPVATHNQRGAAGPGGREPAPAPRTWSSLSRAR